VAKLHGCRTWTPGATEDIAFVRALPLLQACDRISPTTHPPGA